MERFIAPLPNVTRHVTIEARDKESFRHKGLLFETGERRGVAPELADRLRRQLDVLNHARTTADMNLPGYRLHRLKGDRAGTRSVTVSGNCRITFTFEGKMPSMLTLKIITKDLIDAEQLAEQQKETTDASRRDSA